MSNKRNRTPSEYIGYGLYLYFLGLSLRNVVKALSYLHIVKRSHVSIWKWIQKFRHRRILSTRRRNKISEYIVDETILQVGPEYIWLWWVAIEPENGQILAQDITQERNMLIAERFLSCVVRYYGNHPVSTTDGGTWYHQACEFLKMDHHIHSPLWRKALLKELCSISRTGPTVLMTTFHVNWKTVN